MEKAIKNLRPHIVNGCISDPPSDFVSLYTSKGRSAKYGIPVFRCSRGTNPNESLHKGLSQVLGGHRTAPQLANSVMVVYNHRRNHRMAVKYRGVPQDLANVYHGWIIEDIQEESRDFYSEPVHGSWESTKNYQDTGEQVG
ncbi:unnamed protein product, partial [Hapterophycus canaliculatus]